MHKADSVGFSTDLYAFFSVQGRVLSSFLKKSGEVSMGELTVLLAVYEAQRPISVESLAEFLFFGVRTIRKMLLWLEDKSLIAKYADADDARIMRVLLTPEGDALARRLACGLYDVLRRSFWNALPEEDFQGIMKSDMRRCLNNLRRNSVEPFGLQSNTDLPIEVDHLVFWRVVQEEWGLMTRRKAGLSLAESCILHYVCERDGSCSSDVSRALIAPKSAVSLGTRRLVDFELIRRHVNVDDGRSSYLLPTNRGRLLDEKIFSLLDSATREFHMGIDEDDLGIIRAWYARMFANMRAMQKS